jgi:hypothetical protein
MDKNFLRATQTSKVAARSPLDANSGHFAWVYRRDTDYRTLMTESSKPLMDAAESEKDRLRQKLLRLIVQRESRRCQPSPPQPQLKR